MSVLINLPSNVEQQFAAEANKLGVPLADYIVDLLVRKAGSKPMTGAEIVEFWKKEGLIGYRSDITDSQQHARELRRQAERRSRS
ncbi:MAG: hypothetical protein HYS13_07385 [Planctomycetia bacterium]|nr:hypothetical protein [Planctomycetia bacterium]